MPGPPPHPAVAPPHALPPDVRARARAGLRDPWRATLLLIGVVALARLGYLALACPYTLAEDEAFYWEWSRRPAWAYATKGPGVAWAIAAGTRLFGDTELGVRAPAIAFAAILTLAIAALARDATASPRAALYAAACTLLIPLYQIGGVLFTVDMPLIAAWAVGAWGAWRALARASTSAWLILGASIAIGLLFKYTMLFLPAGIAIFALLRRRSLGLSARWRTGLLGAIALALLGVAPILLWNARHDWASLRHLLGHAGLPGGDVRPAAWHYTPGWTLGLLGAQIGLFGPALVLMAVGLRSALRSSPAGAHDPASPRTFALFCLACAAPVLGFYLLLSFIAEPEGNWPVAGFTTLIPLAGWAAARATAPPNRRSLGRLGWRLTLILGILLALASLRIDLLARTPGVRLLERIARNQGWIRPDRPLIPLGRLLGADVMAADVARLAESLRRETGREPFVITQHYGRAGILAFYLHARSRRHATPEPLVTCSGPRTDGRITQYDLWPDTTLDNVHGLGGRPAILVGGTAEMWAPAFAEVRPHGPLEGETKSGRVTYLGFDYRGWPTRAPTP